MQKSGMTNCELVHEGAFISITFKKGELDKIADIAIFDEESELLYSGTIDEAEAIRKAIEFALNYNFVTNESDETNGLENDRQEIE